ncbi:hypothetical protein LMH73_018800 [Vibrio splendidus]|nr:hypothetical protein [Vibrio splendidus]MCC4880759.1 hypothetical protein [Vibrio splendidus]
MVKLMVFCADELEVELSINIDLVSAVRKQELINEFSVSSVAKHQSINKLKYVILGMSTLDEHAEEFIANALIKLKNKDESIYNRIINGQDFMVSKSLFILNKDSEQLTMLGNDSIELEIDHIAINGNYPDWLGMSLDAVEYYRSGSRPRSIFEEDLYIDPICSDDYLININYSDLSYKITKSNLFSMVQRMNPEIIEELQLSDTCSVSFEKLLAVSSESPLKILNSILNIMYGRYTTISDYSLLLLYVDLVRRDLGLATSSFVNVNIEDFDGDAIGLSVTA